MLDTLDKIASILSGFGIFIISILVYFQFKYKHDAEVRALYLKSYQAIWDIACELFQTGQSTNEMHNKITEAFTEAKVYLHEDIVNLIEDIRCKLIKLNCIQSQLEGLKTGTGRSQLCEEARQIKLYIHEKTTNIQYLYRKHLIDDPWNIFLNRRTKKTNP
jgi:Na+/phosphate symporter